MGESREFDQYTSEPHFATAREGGGLTKLIAVLCASALVVALLAGFLFLRKRQADRLASARRAEQPARVASAPPQAQVFQDEVRLKGSDAVFGGTVKNISAAPLEGLSVEITLKGRASQAVETKSVRVSPDSLRPGEEGKYSLQISPTEWAGAQVVRLRSQSQGSDIPFKPEVGAKRPLERPPTGKVVVEQRPRRKGDEFLNTPDTPIRIP